MAWRGNVWRGNVSTARLSVRSSGSMPLRRMEDAPMRGDQDGQSHKTNRQPPLVGVSELIEQLRSLLTNETDLASDTPVKVLVRRQRYALVGAHAELEDDSQVSYCLGFRRLLEFGRT